MIGERSLRHAGRLHDVAHARATESMLMHNAEAFGKNLVAGGRSCHASNMFIHIALSSGLIRLGAIVSAVGDRPP